MRHPFDIAIPNPILYADRPIEARENTREKPPLVSTTFRGEKKQMPRHVSSLLFAGLLLATATTSAKAVPITFNFEGLVTDGLSDDPLGCLVSGNTFSGSYTFESTTVDQNPSADDGFYPQLGANTMTLTFNASCDFTTNYDLTINNSPPPGNDAYLLDHAAPVIEGPFQIFMSIELIDGDGLIFNNDDLPLTPPDLSFFQDLIDGNNVTISGESAELSFMFEGELTSLIPEPATISLVSLAGLLLLRRRR